VVPDNDSITVTSRALEPVVDLDAYEEVLDEISEGLGVPVRREIVEGEPPAAGMSEIASTLSILADSKEVILPVIAWMAGQFGGPVFSKLRAHLERSRRNREGDRPYIPLCIVFGTAPDSSGSVRFYLHGRPDAAQLKHQFDEMYRVIDALPEVALAERAGPPEYGYFWDEVQSRWRGTLFYAADSEPYEMWSPVDLFDRVPGWNAPAESGDDDKAKG
jgi:hypothetical protein